MAVEQPVTGGFLWVATDHHVDQQASAGQTVQRGGLARGGGGRGNAGAHRHQELQALGGGHHGGGYRPRVFAGAAGGNQHPFVAEPVGGLGDLLQVGEVHGTSPLGGTQVMSIAVGG